MSEEMKTYMPSTEELRDLWVDHKLAALPRPEGIELVPEAQAAFDQWLATVRAQALTDVADQMRDRFMAAWIRGKANEHIHGPRKIVGAFAVPETKETTE